MTKKSGKKAKQSKILNNDSNKILYDKISKILNSKGWCSIESIIINKRLCNNTIYGGDCYKGTYCSNGSFDFSVKNPDNFILTETCWHEDYICEECKMSVCGCCYEKKCPICI